MLVSLAMDEAARMLKIKEKTGVATSFDVKEIEALLKMLSEHDVREFTLERNGEKLQLKRSGDLIVHSGTMHSTMLSSAANVSPTIQLTNPVYSGSGYSSPLSSASAESARMETKLSVVAGLKEDRPKLHEVKSPMVGTFYRRSSPDAKAYVEVGDVVTKGSVLCIVEAMKLMNEIESDVNGRIVEACLEDGQMAEYGEVLFRVEPAS